MASHSVYLSVAARSSIPNMFSRILVIFIVAFICICNSDAAPEITKARQYIPALPGFIPVYIRPGDTPLENINLDLAEAFDSYAQKHARLSFGRSNTLDGKVHVDLHNPTDSDLKDISLVGLDDDLTLEDKNEVTTTSKPLHFIHIQKIPRT